MSITLNTKVYTFSGFVQNIAQYLNRGAAAASGFLRLTAAIDGGTGTNPYKVRWKLKLPTIATSSDPCACEGAVIREAFADIVVTIPSSMTGAERTAMAVSLADLCDTPEFQASVADLVVPSA